MHSEHYVISFEDDRYELISCQNGNGSWLMLKEGLSHENVDRFTPFGTKYTLQFSDGVIAESQHLIHFPSLIRLLSSNVEV